MIRTEVRTARKSRRCDTCKAHVNPGDRYLEHVASPNHDDLCNPGWRRIAECAECAIRYGRDYVVTA